MLCDADVVDDDSFESFDMPRAQSVLPFLIPRTYISMIYIIKKPGQSYTIHSWAPELPLVAGRCDLLSFPG